MFSTSSISPRAARTRAALITAGFDLLAAKPIDAIAIDELVLRAGVAKGSFFNHFADKHAFAAAIAAEVRRELEEQVTEANQDVANPIERIANGMRISAQFAMLNPKRSAVLLRASEAMTAISHPLNKGVSRDFDSAAKLGLISKQAVSAGVLFWLGLCQALMASLMEAPQGGVAQQDRIENMMVLGLRGLGIPESEVTEIADRFASRSG